MYVCEHTTVHMWPLEGNFREFVLPFYHVGLGLGGKCLYPVSHLPGIIVVIFHLNVKVCSLVVEH